MAGPDYPVVMLGVPVVGAPLEIDSANADRFGQILLRATRCEHAAVVVDMTGTQFCDSSGVRMLAQAHQRAMGEGRRLLLVVPPAGAVHRVFNLTGLDQTIPTFGDLNDALEVARDIVPRPLEGSR